MASADDRAALVRALRYAVDGEKRFGIRDDCAEELAARWSAVIDLIEKLCRKPPKKP